MKQTWFKAGYRVPSEHASGGWLRNVRIYAVREGISAGGNHIVEKPLTVSYNDFASSAR